MRRTTDQTQRSKPNSITGPGILLGVGFGGLVDGVVLHQILRWHHMLSNEPCCPVTTVRGLELNTIADGLFHVVTMILLFTGTVMLWRRVQDDGVPWSGWQLLGLGLEGWGLFNVVEGIVDHHVLRVHHVHTGPNQSVYDTAFLAFGVVLIFVGHLIARKAQRDPHVDKATANVRSPRGNGVAA